MTLPACPFGAPDCISWMRFQTDTVSDAVATVTKYVAVATTYSEGVRCAAALPFPVPGVRVDWAWAPAHWRSMRPPKTAMTEDVALAAQGRTVR
ncbi:hypothetical protein ADK76_08515 [Streptomyces griseoflavus]|nr:hypothetical protein ADK76_08515 [Streptomyces griseoflavus]